MKFPRVLIVGQTFDNYTGPGITNTNLFKEWPRENLAIISRNENEDWSICGLQYLIGYDEIAKLWPFSYLQDKRPSIILSKEALNKIEALPFYLNNAHLENSELSTRQLIRNVIKKVLNFIGIFLFIDRIKLSENLYGFIEEFHPDIIYTQLSSLDLIRLTEGIHEKYKTPIAIHIMDDWPLIINKSGLFGFLWNKKTHRAFRNLIRKSSVLMTISNAMSQEYKRRYGLDCTAFHNPVESEFCLQKNDNRASAIKYNPYSLTYIGRIGNANEHSLQYFINTVANLNKQYPEIEFNIYSHDFENNKLKITYPNNSIHILPAVPYKDVPLILKSSAVLLLPLDFDKAAQTFAKYSIPTKTTEYMISGTPILVFAPSENAVTKYAHEERWGYIVDREDAILLQKAIIELLKNSDLRNKLIQNSKNTVAKNHDAVYIRNKFRETLHKAANIYF
jgi:glycosyltransferase involved in cell wall biosynthesis